jgi:hypothetical protein
MIGEDPIAKKILINRFEERLLELEDKIMWLKSTDRRFSTDMKLLKNMYNLNLKLAREGGLLADNDPRVYK